MRTAYHNPDDVAKILAKAFLKEMTRAGIRSSQIVYAASELIDQLTNNLHGRQKRWRISRRVHDEAARLSTGIFYPKRLPFSRGAAAGTDSCRLKSNELALVRLDPRDLVPLPRPTSLKTLRSTSIAATRPDSYSARKSTLRCWVPRRK